MARISARRVVVALDCPDAREHAEFQASMPGWRIRDNAKYSDWVQVLAAGARRHHPELSLGERFVVCLDPVGHPFCLCEE